MRTFGLIGYPLSHSFSQKYFTEKFKKEGITDCEFKNFPLENIGDFKELIRSTPSLCGLSVTIPYKRKIIAELNKISKTADEIEAVNCIKFDKRNQLLIGYNTDYEGFKGSIIPLLQPQHTHALILGSGGAAKAVAYALDELQIKHRFVSKKADSIIKEISEPSFNLFERKPLGYGDLNENKLLECKLIINTTPLGMFPNVDSCPDIPYKYLTSDHLLYDLTYNPEETLFLKKGREKGAQIKNGLEMLHLQAEKAWEIWNS